MEGLISNKMTKYQQDYYEYNEDKRKGSKWTRSIIKEGWNILHDVWLHRNKKVTQKGHNIGNGRITGVRESNK